MTPHINHRRFGPSAGMVGFRLPHNASPEHRARYTALRQMVWRPRMAGDGHLGEHTGWTGIRFARRVLAPVVRGGALPGSPLPG